MRLSATLALIALVALVGCGGSSSGVTEEEAAELIAARIISTAPDSMRPAEPAECIRSTDDSRSFECNVDPTVFSSATATVKITVSESGDSYVVNSCERQKADTEELEEIQKDPCRLIP